LLRVRIRNELIPINLLVIILILVITFFPNNVFRIVLALPSLLFFPGYVLIAALYPRRERIEAIDRIALSFGISIVIIPIIGLLLNFSPWGIRLQPVLYSISSFIFVTSIIAWLRRRRFPESERFNMNLQWKLPIWGGSLANRTLSVALLISILGALGTLGYVIAAPKTGEQFTEFYVLDTAGQVTLYPQEINAGTTARVVLGIVNHEYKDITYRLEIRVSGSVVKEINPIYLQNEQKWEQEVGFIPVTVGENQEVEFLLFKEGENEPYRSLHLWIDVIKKK